MSTTSPPPSTPPPSITTPIPGFNKTSDQLVLDLINSANNLTLTLADVSFDSPEQAPSGSSKNTNLSVTSTGTTTLVGTTVVHYNRLDFGIFFGGFNIQVPLPQGATSTADLLPSINNQYGLQLTTDDVISLSLVPTTNLPVTQPMIANVNSYAFTGQFSVQIVAAN